MDDKTKRLAEMTKRRAIRILDAFLTADILTDEITGAACLTIGVTALLARGQEPEALKAALVRLVDEKAGALRALEKVTSEQFAEITRTLDDIRKDLSK